MAVNTSKFISYFIHSALVIVEESNFQALHVCAQVAIVSWSRCTVYICLILNDYYLEVFRSKKCETLFCGTHISYRV